MKPTRTMILGIVIALIGVDLAVLGINALTFRTLVIPVISSRLGIFDLSGGVVFYFPSLSILLIFLGAVVGIISYVQKNRE